MSHQDLCALSYLDTVCDGPSLAIMVIVCDHESADDDDRWLLARTDIDRAMFGIPSCEE